VCSGVIKHSDLGLLFAPIPGFYKSGAANATGMVPAL